MKKVVVLFVAAVMLLGISATSHSADFLTCWFPPGWKTKAQQAKGITKALSDKSGISIRPRIANSYPQILTAFSSDEQSLVYVGSFVQAIIRARDLGTPLVQNINGKDLYSGIMIYPQGEDPQSILVNYPEQIAFTKGASSGESSAKAATAGKAAIPVANHGVAAKAVIAGKAKAAVVKNWWWEKNKQNFSTLAVYKIPDVSIEKNPDNVLTASKAVPADIAEKITAAAIASKEAFGAPEMVHFDKTRLEFPLNLMEKGKIDPLTYDWK